MLTFFTIVHVLLCVFMIFVILLQPGKDSGGMGALGGGASTSAFGGRGAETFLSKLTAICAALFFITSLGLSFVGLKRSVVADTVMNKPAATAPATAGGKGTEGGGTPIPATGVVPQGNAPEQAPAAPATPAGQTAPAAPSGNPPPASNSGK